MFLQERKTQCAVINTVICQVLTAAGTFPLALAATLNIPHVPYLFVTVEIEI